jgi:coiled-coil and C2 domain-containing protein 2A
MIEWVIERGFDPNDPRNDELLKLRELVESVCGSLHQTSAQAFWKGREFFRLGIPRWLHRMTLGVGVLTTYNRLKMLCQD